MHVITGTFEPFIGGQLEIQNDNEGYIYRGEIERVTVKNSTVKVHFAWLGKNDGHPSSPSSEWTVNDQLDCEMSLEIYSASSIGMGRLCLHSPFVGETCIFFPKGYMDAEGNERKLDRSRVKGL